MDAGRKVLEQAPRSVQCTRSVCAQVAAMSLNSRHYWNKKRIQTWSCLMQSPSPQCRKPLFSMAAPFLFLFQSVLLVEELSFAPLGSKPER